MNASIEAKHRSYHNRAEDAAQEGVDKFRDEFPNAQITGFEAKKSDHAAYKYDVHITGRQ